MMQMMFGTTRSLGRVAMYRQPAMRAFSTVVPIEKPSHDVPAELQSTPLTDAYFKKLDQQYDEFNESCRIEAMQMNDNIIEAILDRGGIEGWNYNKEQMTKAFNFDSFEQCQHFCDAVSLYANETDHHPEWSLSNGGRTVDVMLTSHFADNKVTKRDYQLAEAMNKQYQSSTKSFRMYPRFDRSQIVSMQIGAVCFLLGGLVIKAVTDTESHGLASLKSGQYTYDRKDIKEFALPKTQMQVNDVSTHAALVRQHQFYDSKEETAPVASL